MILSRARAQGTNCLAVMMLEQFHQTEQTLRLVSFELQTHGAVCGVTSGSTPRLCSIKWHDHANWIRSHCMVHGILSLVAPALWHCVATNVNRYLLAHVRNLRLYGSDLQ